MNCIYSSKIRLIIIGVYILNKITIVACLHGLCMSTYIENIRQHYAKSEWQHVREVRGMSGKKYMRLISSLFLYYAVLQILFRVVSSDFRRPSGTYITSVLESRPTFP